jgi:very-short-patch-repair endonuclease
LGSWEFHKTRAAFERDRTRDAALLVAGYRVVRITFLQIRDDPGAVATTIRPLLAKAA